MARLALRFPRPFLLGLSLAATAWPAVTVGQRIPTPAEHFGHGIGADRKLVRWDGIVEYMQLLGNASDRVRVEEVGRTTHDRPFLLVEVSAPETLADIDRYKTMQRRLYFQDHRPGQDPDAVHSEAQRRELFDQHKAVVLITATIHSTEVGAAQMSLELIHHLATDDSPETRKILDNVIFLLVPSMNPDGQAMVVDWYNLNVGTQYEGGRMPWLYHPYVGHDDNRDMYMFSQQETRLIGQILYDEWFPSIWLDEHQMGSSGPRIFVMPATDPINVNVHPLIYRLNGIYGQAQAAALEAAGKVGIVYDYVYTNFWPGAMAWTGWWHNQVGMLTEVASVQIATPTEQHIARLGDVPAEQPSRFSFQQLQAGDTLPAPWDVQPRSTYPRPWLGGRWTLRDIVEYEMVATLALLETAADTRRQLLEHVYEVNRSMIAQFRQGQGPEMGTGGYGRLPGAVADNRRTGRVMAGFAGASGTPYAVIVEPDQYDPATAAKMLQILERAGVVVERATAPFDAGGTRYPAGTYVLRLAQPFGAYAKEMLEAQTYPEVRAAPDLPPDPPYDVTAWSLGLQMGVETVFAEQPFEAVLEVVDGVSLPAASVTGSGETFVIDASYNDAFTLTNRLWNGSAAEVPPRVRRATTGFVAGPGGRRLPPGTWVIDGVGIERMRQLATEYGVAVQAVEAPPSVPMVEVTKPTIGLYQPWGSNMDEGWTRWVLERYGFDYTTLHPQDVRAGREGASRIEIQSEFRSEWPRHVAEHAPARVTPGPLADRFDVLVFTHQDAKSIVEGEDDPTLPPPYDTGLGEEGLDAVRQFLESGGTVVALGSATDLFLEHWPVPVKNVAADLDTDQFLIPGSIVRIETDPSHPIAWGMPAESHAYFIRSPFFALREGFASQTVSVPVRYPNTDLRASGWVRGAAHLAGRAAAVQVDFAPAPARETGRPGRLVLLGVRAQHRAQTHATFKLFFNALVRGRSGEGAERVSVGRRP